jgi:thiamine-phosphate pyrophosphorylase
VSPRGDRQGRRPGPIYAIADVERLGAARVAHAVAAMASGGIDTIQIRAKRAADRELARVASDALGALEGWPGELWIDDRVDLARALGFAGVHLGQRDLEARAARALLNEECAIGVSTHDERQLAAADADSEADWLALGPIFATRSKEAPEPVVGLERLRACRSATRKPLIAIGGIDESNLAAVLAAGADAVAVLSAVCDGDVGAAARRLVARAEEARCASS